MPHSRLAWSTGGDEGDDGDNGYDDGGHDDYDLFSSRAGPCGGVCASVGLLIPVIKAVIRGDNGGREIAALLWG